MKPPKCRFCGKAHWSNVACDGGSKLPPGAAPAPTGSSRPLHVPKPSPPPPEEATQAPAATIKDSEPIKKLPKDGGRLQRWREKNREKYNADQRVYMRKWRAKKKAEKKAEGEM